MKAKFFFGKVFTICLLTTILYVGTIFLYNKLHIDSTPWFPNVKILTGANKGGSLQRFQELQKIKSANVLVVGSSHACRSFDSRIFKKNGIEIFNMGSVSQTPTNSYYLLKEYLPKLKPQYIIFETYFNASCIDGIEPTLDIISNHPINKNIVSMSLSNMNLLVFNCLVSNCIERLQYPYETIVPKKSGYKKFIAEKYVPGGFIEFEDRINTKSPETLANLEEKEIKLNPKHTENLEKIVKLCKTYNAQLIFVNTPITKEYLSKVKGYKEYSNRISQLGSRNGIPLFDYNLNNHIKLESQVDFHDMNHLNQIGVEKFDSIFIADFKGYLRSKNMRAI